MKLKINNNLISLLAIIVFVISGCNKSNESPVIDKSKEETRKNIYKEIEEDVYRERISLLALKYGIDEIKATSIIDEYDKHIDRPDFITIEKAMLNNQFIEVKKLNYFEIVDQISKKYNVPKKEIAAFIIDYRKKKLLE